MNYRKYRPGGRAQNLFSLIPFIHSAATNFDYKWLTCAAEGVFYMPAPHSLVVGVPLSSRTHNAEYGLNQKNGPFLAYGKSF
jgi:hypothetical protein